MCLVIVVPGGVDKMSDELWDGIRKSHQTNNDGAGYGIKSRKDSLVYHDKGVWTFDMLYNKIKNAGPKTEDELVIHLRKKSSGVISASDCHPFICHTDVFKISPYNPGSTTYPVLFHNGHFSEFNDPMSGRTDTFNFVKHFMSNQDVYTMLKKNRKDFMNLFGDVIGTNKLAIMYPRSGIPTVKVGDFIYDRGIYWSNDTYKTDKVNVGGVTIQNVKVEADTEEKGWDIPIDEDNNDEFVFKANCNVATDGILKGECFVIWGLFGQTKISLKNIKTDSYKFIKRETFNSCFDAFPKEQYKEKYSSYRTLKETVRITDSSLRELESIYHKAVLSKDGDVEDDKLISVPIGVNGSVHVKVRFDALEMFINEAELNKHKVDIKAKLEI